MTERTGLGVVELTILCALSRLGAGPDLYIKSAEVLAAVEDEIGLAPGYAYPLLCDLARSWVSHIRLVDVHGDLGAPDQQLDAAGPRYTEAGLSRAGDLVLRAEEGEIAPLPVGLVNGDLHAGGSRPPFEPSRVVGAIVSLHRDPSLGDRALRSLIGPPAFPVGCAVEGNVATLLAGRPAELRLLARIQVDDATRTIVIDRIPPGAGAATAAKALANRSELHKRYGRHEGHLSELHRLAGLPLLRLEHDEERVVCEPQPAVDLDGFVEQVLTIYPIQSRVQARLPAPMPTILGNWVAAFGSEDIDASLAALAESVEATG